MGIHICTKVHRMYNTPMKINRYGLNAKIFSEGCILHLLLGHRGEQEKVPAHSLDGSTNGKV